MSIENLLLQYQERGVEFSTENGKLHFRAEKNILTEKDKEVLKKEKERIIKYLLEYPNSDIIECRENRYDEFPLTEIQLSYLVGQDNYYMYGGTSCKVYTEIEFDGLIMEQVQNAWNNVVESNDMLHAVIESTGVQRILENFEVPAIKCEDLREKNPREVDEIIKDKRQKLINKKYRVGTWPLFDIEISKLKEKDIMHFSLDMLIADFVSINLIFDEFEQFYYMKKSDCLTQLSFRDIVIYRENLKKTNEGKKKYEEDKRYWSQKIATMPGTPQFPTVENYSEENVVFSQMKFVLEKLDYEKIRNIARKEQLTPSSIILAAYAETLKKFSKNKAFCIDVTMSDRPMIHPDIKKVIGDFTIADILEIKDIEYETYLDEIKSIQARLWEDLGHNSYSSTEVLRELGKRLKTEIVVPAVYTSTLGAMNDEKNRKGNIIYTISQTPQVLIDCQVLENKGKLQVNWDVRNGAFPAGMIEEAFENFCELIYKFTNEECLYKKPISELAVSVKRIREKANETTKKIEEHYIYDGFLKSLKEYPNNPALYSDGKTYTYKDLACYVSTVQNVLMQKGYVQGDIVTVAISRNVWQIATVLATVLLGGTYLPLDIHQPSERAEKIVKSARSKYCVLEDKDFINEREVIKIKVSDLKNIFNEEINLKVFPTDLNAPAYVIFTSGSTGTPKGVVISHLSATNTIIDINQRYNVTENDKILNLANLGFDLSVYDIFGAFFAGAEVIQVSEEKVRDPEHWSQIIEKQKVSIFNSVPGQMKMLTMFLDGKTENIVSDLRLVLLSGDWIPTDLPKNIRKHFSSAEIVSLGGATEAAIWSIYYPIDPDKQYERSIPYGKPLSNQRFYILNDRFEEVPNWVTGEIYIAGKGLALEYLGDEELTGKKFIYSENLKERLYKTGDVGRYMPDGNIEFQGRMDFQIKIRGHRIELGEIEAAISEILSIKDLKTVVVNHNSVINICAFVVLEKGDALNKIEMDEKLGKKIPNYMLPSLYIYVDKIPLTLNGKIDIKKLNALAVEEIEDRFKVSERIEELSEIQRKIYGIWCEMFGTEEISIDEDFFDCGGDSILIVKLITELAQRYNYQISITDVYAGPTIREMAKNICI